MNISYYLEKIFLFIQDFLSFLTGGSTCIGCGVKTLALPLCKDCKSIISNFVPFDVPELNLSFNNPYNLKRCNSCGKILLSELQTCSECGDRVDKSNSIQYFPLHSYRLWKKDLIYRWKSENVRSLSFYFAELIYTGMMQLQKSRKLKFDSIVPVPPRPGKIREKGWDQIDELCSILKSRYKLSVEYPLVRYTKEEQKKMSRDERKSSGGAEYGLKNGVIVKGKKVLIIDDVITTGSTMEKCAFLLKKAGVREVYGMSLFIVD